MTVAFAPLQVSQQSKTCAKSNAPVLPSIGIIGSGPHMQTMACYLSGRGYPVQVMDRPDGNEYISTKTSSVTAEGAIKGQYDRQTYEIKPEGLLNDCFYLIVVAKPSSYKELVWSLSAWLKNKHTIMLYGGGIGACLEFEKYLHANGVSGVKVVEIDPLFHCQKQSSHAVKVHAMRQWGQFASTSPSKTFDCDSMVTKLLPKVEPASNFLSRGLCDFQAIVYPIEEAFGADAEMGAALAELVSASGAGGNSVFNAIESELNDIAEAYSTPKISTILNIRRMYGAIASTPAEAVAMVPKYGQAAPWQDMIKTLGETISNVYVPLYELSRLANLRTPAIDSVINMSAVMCGVDFLTQGRTLSRMGLEGLSQREIVKRLNG